LALTPKLRNIPRLTVRRQAFCFSIAQGSNTHPADFSKLAIDKLQREAGPQLAITVSSQATRLSLEVFAAGTVALYSQ